MDEQEDHHKQLTGLEVYFTREELRALLALVENSEIDELRGQQDQLDSLAQRIRQAINNDTP